MRERLDPSLPVATAARRTLPEPPPWLSSPIGSRVHLAGILALAAILQLYRVGGPRRGTREET